MNYFFLGIACFLFSVQFLFSKRYQLKTGSTLTAAVGMTVFDSIWLIALFFTANRFTLQVTRVSFLYAAFYSGFTIVCAVASLFAMRYGKVSTVCLFLLTGGLILPVVYGILLLGEPFGFRKAAGIVFILISFFVGNLVPKKTTEDEKNRSHKIRSSLFYITCFISNGMISVITKAHSISANTAPERDFLILAAILRLLMGLAILAGLFLQKKTAARPAEQKPLAAKQILPLFLIVGGYTLCNGIANDCSLITAKTMDSSLQFPMISAAVVLMTAFIGWAVYQEKPSKGEAIGMAFTLCGILLMIG